MTAPVKLGESVMGKNEPVISLCIPTNGVMEWVIPVLDSIYSQDVNEEFFEVIVTDNGNNHDFYLSMLDYQEQHTNMIYARNTAFLFDNQLESLKLASGKYFKFVNHRAVFERGALEKIIEIIEKYEDTKPVLYFSNGAINTSPQEIICDSFDQFVNELGIYASWTTGVGIWKDDYRRIPKDQKFDIISPHSAILFSEREKARYIICNFVFSHEVSNDQSKKGRYDLFKAFAVEEFAITLNLFIDGSISAKTLKNVKKKYKRFVSELYWDYCILKKPCSYILDGFDDAMGVFYSKGSVVAGAYFIGCMRLIKKVFRQSTRFQIASVFCASAERRIR